MSYYHGVRTNEQKTNAITPRVGTSGLIVAVGTAPVHTVSETGNIDKPIIAYSYEEAVEKLGYSDDWGKYTLCQVMYACFKVYNIAPVIFINVLDPSTQKIAIESQTVAVTNKVGIVNVDDCILDDIVVKSETNSLALNTDYVLAYVDGKINITILSTSTYADKTTLTVTGNKVDISAPASSNAALVTKVIGGYSSTTGKNSGISCIEDIYPMSQLTPGLLIAPGFSNVADVSTAMQAATTKINGDFMCECVIDIDSTLSGAQKCEDVNTKKTSQGVALAHAIPLWPMVKNGSKVFYYSAIYAAMVAYTDSANDDIPSLSPSNKQVLITATVLDDADHTEILIDKVHANDMVNAFGVVTAINNGGWRTWGNNTACYPTITDPKDRWICCRRFHSYYNNHLILTFAENVDDLTNTRLIQSVCDTENVWFNANIKKLAIAGGSISFDEKKNTIDKLLAGHTEFDVRIAEFIPNEDMLFNIEFDPTILQNALGGEV